MNSMNKLIKQIVLGVTLMTLCGQPICAIDYEDRIYDITGIFVVAFAACAVGFSYYYGEELTRLKNEVKSCQERNAELCMLLKRDRPALDELHASQQG